MKQQYSDTLNLLNTGFPMRGDLARREPDMLTAWQQNQLYDRLRTLATAQNRPPFVLHDGPPYANGDLHIGHAINKILKDMIVRAKTLSGYNAPYLPGWDCHGLPIEHQVEKKGGDRRVPDAFRRQCRAFAESQINRQKKDFVRMGIMGEWETPYKTMHPQTEAGIIRTLGRIYARGLISRRLKPVFWCADCQSALAEAEVEYEDHESQAVDVAFAAADNAAVNAAFAADNNAPVFAVIWTTTIWTLPGNRAIVIHPEMDYVLVEHNARRYIVAAELRQASLIRWRMENAATIGNAKGATLAGLNFLHPFYERNSPLFIDTYVTAEAGSGLVHTAPGHGEDDFNIGVKHQLPLASSVDESGHFLPSLPLFGGMNIWKATAAIADTLKQNGALLAKLPYSHSYPKCWRHKSPVLFRADWQWFMDMDSPRINDKTLRETALAAIADTHFYPHWGRTRMHAMVAGRPDWCLSRQRFWNVPIPFFLHKETGELHPQTADITEKAAQIVERGGIESWFSTDDAELLGTDAPSYRRVRDTLDVWFDSGTTHQAVMHWNGDEQTRPDLYLEGSDQHRGWFQSSLLTGCAIYGRAPYRQILTHGFVVAGDGRKMSKSLGNVISPQEIIKKQGADILRLWTAAADYSGEIAISDEILKRVVEMYRRLRNTTRFLLANLSDFDSAQHAVAVADMLEIDRLMLYRGEQFRTEVNAAYERYEFHEVMKKLQHFCSLELGSFYLDILKDRLYTCPANSVARRSAQSALWHLTQMLIKIMAPALCFTADEAWRTLTGDDRDSPLLHTWNTPLPLSADAPMLAKKWQHIGKWRDLATKEIEKQRIAGTINSSLQACLVFGAKNDAALESLGEELRHVFIVSQTTITAADHSLIVQKSPHAKCARCWHYEPEVGADTAHPELCGRCLRALDGECTRQFV